MLIFYSFLAKAGVFGVLFVFQRLKRQRASAQTVINKKCHNVSKKKKVQSVLCLFLRLSLPLNCLFLASVSQSLVTTTLNRQRCNLVVLKKVSTG